MITFEEALDLVSQLPIEQQEMLVDIVKRRYLEIRRKELAEECFEALAEYREGKLIPKTAQAAISDLHNYLSNVKLEKLY
jgi:hypothetical protein